MSDIATEAEIKTTQLDEVHRRLGASIGERNGWAVPLSYGDSVREYEAVRGNGAGLVDLSSRTRINVSGSEAAQFLNGLITNDVKSLKVGTWMPAVFPNAQGRLIAIVRVLHRADGFLFDTDAATRDIVLKTLERFTLAGDFHVTELTDQLAAISLQGSRSAEILVKLIGDDAVLMERGEIVESDWDGRAVCIIRATHSAEDGFDLLVNTADAETLWNALMIAGAEPVGFDALDFLRIEAGIPVFGVDVDASNVMLEAGLDDAVSFTKGCYIGQEIIARIHWRGHVAKKIAGIVFDEACVIRRDDKLHSIDGKEIGRVTSACFSPGLNRQIALCMIKYDYLAVGTQVIAVTDDGEFKAHVVELPLVRGSWYEGSATEHLKIK